MKKTFLIIGITALIILFIAAILAILSVFNLFPFFSNLVVEEQAFIPEDQVVILFARVDSLENKKFFVEEATLLYLVASRMDTAIVQEMQQIGISDQVQRRGVSDRQMIRLLELNEKIEIDYVFYIDTVGWAQINKLLENQQSSVSFENPGQFCEILLEKDFQFFDFVQNEIQGHYRTTIPAPLIEQIDLADQIGDSIYCESIE